MANKKQIWRMSVSEYKRWASENLSGDGLVGLAFSQDGQGRPTKHKREVLLAIFRGRTIPNKVLDCYSDLSSVKERIKRG